jgi:hypothetical protein
VNEELKRNCSTKTESFKKQVNNGKEMLTGNRREMGMQLEENREKPERGGRKK